MKNRINALLAFVIAMAATLSSAIVNAETITYYHLDALDSPVAASDESGAILWREEYAPYGDRIRIEDPSNTHGFTGKFHEEDIGLTYFGARWYDPVAGRFMGIDPVEYREGDSHSFNRYAYANNNPYKYVDPDGRAAAAALWVVGIGLFLYDVFSTPELPEGHENDAITSVDTYPGPITMGKLGRSAINVAEASTKSYTAARRLGIDLDNISIVKGVARGKIDFSSTLDSSDIRIVKDALKSKGANKAEIDTGLIGNPKLDEFLRRRAEDGKPFHGGRVRHSNSRDSDFTIEFDL